MSISCSDRSWIMLQSAFHWSEQFTEFAGSQNFVTGAVFGNVGGWLLLVVMGVSCVRMMKHEWHFFVAGAMFGDVGGGSRRFMYYDS